MNESTPPPRILPATNLDSGDVTGTLCNPRCGTRRSDHLRSTGNFWTQLDALVTQPQPKVADMMWSRTDLKPADVDIAQLYEGFTFHTLNRLENFGFCEIYSTKDFIEGDARIAREKANCRSIPAVVHCQQGGCTPMARSTKPGPSFGAGPESVR